MKTQVEIYLSSCKRFQSNQSFFIIQSFYFLCWCTSIQKYHNHSFQIFKSSGENYCLFCFVYCNRLYITFFPISWSRTLQILKLDSFPLHEAWREAGFVGKIRIKLSWSREWLIPSLTHISDNCCVLLRCGGTHDGCINSDPITYRIHR